MSNKELKLKVAEAIQDDVNKGKVTSVPGLYSHLMFKEDIYVR